MQLTYDPLSKHEMCMSAITRGIKIEKNKIVAKMFETHLPV